MMWSEATACIDAAESILLVTHVKPDGDAIGSLVGLGLALQQRGKTAILAVDGGTPDFAAFLHGAEQVQAALSEGDWAVMISVDASDEARSGEVGAYGRAHAAKVINIDHHPTNTLFGDLHLVAADAASTTEVIFDWLTRMGQPILPDVAAALLTGLVTDTIGFRTNNVRPRTLEVAHALMVAGADMADIMTRTLVSRSFSQIELWKNVFPSIRLLSGVASAVVTQENLRAANLRDMTDAGLVSTLAAADEVKVAAVFKEQPQGQVEISFRSKPGHDVGTLALGLGGGGHELASGVTVTGTLDEVQARVMPLLHQVARNGSSRA